MSLFKIPELEGMDKLETKAIWKEASKRAYRKPSFWLVPLALAFLFGEIGAEMSRLFVGIGAGVGGGLGALWQMKLTRPYVVTVVSERKSITKADNAG